MKTTFSKSLPLLSTLFVAFWLLAPRTVAGEARFFRIVGPTATTITAFTPDGYITWTNAQIGTNYTIQTALSLGAATNWVDYIQVPASNSAVTHRLYDPNPPSDMVLIPAGSFTMGDDLDGLAYIFPPHSVYISAFYMGKYEVTKALWVDVYNWATNHGYSFDDSYPGLGKAATHPVLNIRWYDMVKWCNARSEQEGLMPCYYTSPAQTTLYQTGNLNLTNACVKWTANGYRLPTEAEWEKAARGGASGHRFPWSDVDTIQHSRANYQSSSSYAYDTSPTRGYHPTFATNSIPYTSPVGYFAPNGYGLYDMAGNAYERCWDWYDSGWYFKAEAAQNDTRGPSGALGERILRGGAWNNYASGPPCASRNAVSPSFVDIGYGFRCVRGL